MSARGDRDRRDYASPGSIPFSILSKVGNRAI
jgi:hypothetical protein